MTYAQGGLVAATDYNTRRVNIDNVWGIGSGSYGWGQPTLGVVSTGETVSAAQAAFDIDVFVANYRGSYSAVIYKAQALLVYPYYASNDEYTITYPTTASRWGLYKYPDGPGLAYWTDQLLAGSGGVVTTPNQTFTNQFFAAVDAFPGYTRDKTPFKSFDYGAIIEWAKLIETLNNVSIHENGASAGLTVPTSGDIITFLNTFDSNMNTLCDVGGGTNNRFGTYSAFSDQGTVTGVHTSAWGSGVSSITNIATVTWATANAARYFFNAGGRINIQISYSGGSGSPQDNNWATVCSNAGTMWLQAIAVGGTASGGYGYWQSAGRMYSANGSGAYASNTLTVDVSGQGSSQLTFTTTFTDNHTNGPWFDQVSGTFSVAITVRRPTMTGLESDTWGTATVSVPNF